MKSGGNTDIPVNKRAYVMYHMAKQRIYDKELMSMMEEGLQNFMEADTQAKLNDSIVTGHANVTGRYAMAAVIGYWRTNLGSAWALKYWELQMKDNS